MYGSSLGHHGRGNLGKAHPASRSTLCGHPVPERIRVLGIDAPESHEPRCERELVAGLKAKERLAQLVRAEVVSVTRDGKDRYGRTLATLSAGGKDIGAVLIAEKLALPWQDGPQARAARIRRWCG